MASTTVAEKQGRSIVVLVDESRASEAAFVKALAEATPADSLLVVFPRPPASAGQSYTAAMKQVTASFDRKSDAVLKKYSALASAAKIPCAVRDVEGSSQAALAGVCEKVHAELLLVTASRWPLAWGPTHCPHCNPYLRGTGRLVRASTCDVADSAMAFPCPTLFSYPSAAAPSSHASWVSQLWGSSHLAPASGQAGYVALTQAA